MGDFYPRQGVAALASAGIGFLSQKITDDRLKLGFSYEKKDGKTDIYGFELTISGKKPEDDKDKTDDKKSPEKGDPATASKTNQQKQDEASRKVIEGPASITVAGKFGGGGGQGLVTFEAPTAVGRFSIAPSLQVTPGIAPYFKTDLKLATRILGGRFDFGLSIFANSPVSKDSPFKTNL